MGIYDRDYYRQQQRPTVSPYLPSSIVGTIIAINVAVWLADFFSPETFGGGRWLSDHLAVHVDTLRQPWLWWQYLTAGFVHSPNDFQHILFNMLGLFFLGRDVEDLYGRREFLRLYLVMVVVSFVVWDLANVLAGTSVLTQAYGASGAIVGVVILYALNFPRRTLLLFFVIPIPAWVLGMLLVASDVYTAIMRQGNVAVSAHLAGAAFAFVYYQRRWNLTRLTNFRFHRPTLPPAPRTAFACPSSRRSRRTKAQRRGRSHSGEDLSRGRGEPDRQGTKDARSRQPGVSAQDTREMRELPDRRVEVRLPRSGGR